MCISETIHKLKVSLSILTSPMEYDKKIKRIKILAASFYTDGRGTSKGAQKLYINICSNKNFKNTLLNR